MEKETLATWPEAFSEDWRLPPCHSGSGLALPGRADYIASSHSGCHLHIEIFTGGKTKWQFRRLIQMYV
jgi:hypothetical protein